MSRTRRGFTLVEILIVVMIIGILAAIALPHLSEASDDTKLSALSADLQTVRKQIQMYKEQHKTAYPTDFATMMVQFTDADGDVSAARDAAHQLGPYMLAVPRNPYTNAATVTLVTGIGTAYAPAADMLHGWWFNSDTGEFRCHVPDSIVTPDGIKINSL